MSHVNLPSRRRAILLLDMAQQRMRIEKPYDEVAILLMATAFIVGLIYCLDALYGERRDRSILFWKSLPVSDRTTVLAKMCIPLFVLPVIVFVIIIATQLVMLLSTNGVLLMSGLPMTTSSQLPFLQNSLILLYGLITLALWHAPIYAWLLVLSAWAKRSPVLWAVLPPMVLAIVERIVFSSTHFASWIKYRFSGSFVTAFAADAKGRVDSFNQLTPARFLSTPGLWTGLFVAAALLIAAMHLRRNRTPI
jgi:ABC-2 type transport system permease protein